MGTTSKRGPLRTDRLLLTAATIRDLLTALRGLDVKVPGRAGGRTNDHVETYSIVRLLGTLSWRANDFPMQLHKSERPDFALSCGGRWIGIEHTEAITKNAAKEAFLRSKGHGPESYFLRPMILDEPSKTSGQLIAEIEADEFGTGWCGDSIERSWIDAMSHFVSEKVAVATRAGFQLVKHNWLLIYDMWTAPILAREKAVPELSLRLDAMAPWPVFERIFILNDSVLTELSCGSAHSFIANSCI